MSINIVKQTGYANTTALNGRSIKYIVIHYTAGSTSKSGTAKNTAVIFSDPAHGASADFIVDDANIVQYNPDVKNRFCWHCGDNRSNTKGGSYYGKCTNANSIGIEICSTNPNWSASDTANSPKWSFTDAAVSKAVELTKYLMQTYNIPASNVIRHYDVSGKLCPGIIGWNENGNSTAKWNRFKAQLTGTNQTKTDTATSDTLYRVRKSADDSKTQLGAFKSLDNAKALAEKNSGYSVYDTSGKLVYTSTNTTAKKTVTELAKEVIAGKWGNGSERKTALEKAGYDYNAVQSKVNELMR